MNGLPPAPATKDPAVAIVTTAKGTFFKPLYEALAQSQPAPWRTVLLWPEKHLSEHPDAAVTPVGANVEIVRVPCAMLGAHAVKQTFLPSRALWRALSQRNVRAIIIHEFSPYTLLGLLFGRRRGIPVVVSSEIGKMNAHFFGPRVRAWHAVWGRFVQGIVACSPAAHTPLSGRTLPTVAAYHAVDSRIYIPAIRHVDPKSPVVFCYLGQLIPRKGIDILIQAAARLRSQGNMNFKILLIGSGDTEWARRLAAEAGLADCVEFTGFLSGAAMRARLAGGDVFVLPTRQDTYAAVVHEAACLGLPLLISKHAGAADALVKQGVNGFVFDPGNPAELAVRMGELMEPDLRLRMGAQSRAIGETFSAHERGRALWEWLRDRFSLC